jgi:hypothetical protein
MRGNGIYATKLANETSPWTPMYGIKGELVFFLLWKKLNTKKKSLGNAHPARRTSENSAYR